MKISNIKIIWFIIVLVAINLISSKIYKRFDLTNDQRYSVSQATINILHNIEENVFIEVYLTGDFPAEFKRLQIETKLFLEEVSSLNHNVKKGQKILLAGCQK